MTARYNGLGDLLYFGGGENEYDVLGWFFEYLEQCVKGTFGKHMHFVDDVDLVACAIEWWKDRFFTQLSNIVYSGMGSSVDLYDAERGSLKDLEATGAFATGVAILWFETVERKGEYSSNGGLSCSSGSGKKVGVTYSSGCYSIFEGFNDVCLSFYLRKVLGTVFSVECFHKMSVKFIGSPSLLSHDEV